MSDLVVCADVGSTFTKVAVVDIGAGALAATAAHPTTVTTDVLHGLDAAIAHAADVAPGAQRAPILVCSSAGGGLRLAVVGYESLVTAEAGRRVGLSAGARVTHLSAGPLGAQAVAQLKASRPDVVLLVGGTDGGDAEVLLHNAARLAAARFRVPVVVAGNIEARSEACAMLEAHAVRFVATDNVLPRIGVLNPAPARAAIREMFLRHVIGGKKLSKGRRFVDLVRGATPDLVLTGVETLADHLGGDLAVIDIGGATTDVYAVLTPDPEQIHGPKAEAAGTLWRSRTVEGDLGMRWSATGVIEAAELEKLPVDPDLPAAAARRAADPGLLAATTAEQDADMRIAALAATVAMRRHARGEQGGPPRKDLRDVRVIIGSGGVLRHAPAGKALAPLRAAVSDLSGGWPLPRNARPLIDVDYVLAPAGLLATQYSDISVQRLRKYLHIVSE
jgi:uncharacterized protein (TIGR01319 family)